MNKPRYMNIVWKPNNEENHKIKNVLGSEISNVFLVMVSFCSILFKNSNTSTNWEIYDTTRPYGVSNPALRPLYANRDYVEETHATLPLLDILSNGFKIRGADTSVNKTSNHHIYLAFADQPFKYANGKWWKVL